MHRDRRWGCRGCNRILKEKILFVFIEKNYKLGQELRNYKPFQQQNEADKTFQISMN